MKNIRSAILALTLGATVALPLVALNVSLVAASSDAGKFKVGLAILDGINDDGFNHLADIGLKEAKKSLKVQTSITVTPQNGNYQATLQSFVNQHDNLVIAVGALWGNALDLVAKANKSVHFAIVDGYPLNSKNQPQLLKNVATLQFKSEQSGYVAGVIAGLMEKKRVGVAKHNSIAALGAIPLPFIIAQACGYWEGAKSVDKSVKFSFSYINSANPFFDPQAAQSVGQKQISDDHADILFGVADGSGPGYYKAASQAHKYAIGFAADQDNLGSFMLTSAEVGIQVAVYRTIASALKGKFTPYGHQFSFKNGGISYAKDMHHVPMSIQKNAAKVASKLAKGKLMVKPMCKLPVS